MTQSIQPGRFGQSSKPDDAWLAKQEKEPILEPELPIIDTHHHLWDRGGWTYLLPELLADLNTGHNIVATVFEECRSMYRANGPVEMRPVGEVEFVAGIAAMSAGGGHGPIKVAQGIVGYADLTLGDRVEPVLEVTWVGSSKMEMRTRLFPRDAGQPCRLTRRDGARPPVVEGKHEEIDENRGGCFPWRGFCAPHPDGADIRPRAEQQHSDDGAATTQTFASVYAPR